ncbi:MAG: cyclic nucleotide-binding domain-containing protein [Paenibacillaceae bacterium]|nr:cyclic nucleotide-binding domain-containing protein [Paenibacillaceae bacterium]
MQMNITEQRIRNIFLQFHLSDMDLGDSALLRFAPGELILQEGMEMEYFLLVVSGKAKVCSASANGKDLLLCYYISEGIIGDVELMTGSHIANATISAVTEFICIGLPYKKYEEKLKQNLPFVNDIGRELASKLIRSSKKSVITALHTCEERLCAFILFAEQEGIFLETLADTSKSIGASYRQTFRVMNMLCRDGVIRKENRVYRIVDRRELLSRTPDFYLE